VTSSTLLVFECHNHSTGHSNDKTGIVEKMEQILSRTPKEALSVFPSYASQLNWWRIAKSQIPSTKSQ
jgi:hypothetical protein